MSKSHSRRAILAGIAAAPAVALPAVALADPSAADKVTLEMTREEADRMVAGLQASQDIALREAARLNREIERVKADPIFAAIERHKTAYRLSQEAGRIRSGTIDSESDPEYDPVKCPAIIEASEAADEDADDAAHALTTVRPTTMAGVLALIRHVEAFNAGAFFLEPLPDDTMIHWQSKPMFWPADVGEDQIDLFGFAILANVRCALEAMAGVS